MQICDLVLMIHGKKLINERNNFEYFATIHFNFEYFSLTYPHLWLKVFHYFPGSDSWFVMQKQPLYFIFQYSNLAEKLRQNRAAILCCTVLVQKRTVHDAVFLFFLFFTFQMYVLARTPKKETNQSGTNESVQYESDRPVSVWNVEWNAAVAVNRMSRRQADLDNRSSTITTLVHRQKVPSPSCSSLSRLNALLTPHGTHSVWGHLTSSNH